MVKFELLNVRVVGVDTYHVKVVIELSNDKGIQGNIRTIDDDF